MNIFSFYRVFLFLITYLYILQILIPNYASALECKIFDLCNGNHSSGGTGLSNPAYPSSSSKINVNPSAVPIEKGLGIEGIYYKNSVDFLLAEGFGRSGAAISPANSEETFFGPPAFELPEDYYERKLKREKYQSQKWGGAIALKIWDNKRPGLEHMEVRIGAMARYNKLSRHVSPGGGMSGIFGPFTFGYSLTEDQTVLDYESRYGILLKPSINAKIESYAVGIFLDSVTIDYSALRILTNDVLQVTLLTASLLLQRASFTASLRSETSQRISYNYTYQNIEDSRKKSDIFLGAKWAVNGSFMLGGFYNYYLQREYTISATVFI